MADDMERRRFLFRAFGGFMGVALGGMWAEAGELPGAMPGPHFRPRARSVIFLFMCGGVSHLDTFDPKGNAHAGRLIDAVGFGDNQARMQRPVIPCHRTFARRGASGIPVSDWFPHVGGVIDEIAVVRSMWCHEVNHFPAVIETCTGHRGRQFDHPSFGAWISHALGSANRNLPTFVNLGRPSSPVQLTGGYLGAGVSATPFQAGAEPVANLRPPGGMSGAARERWMERLEGMNAEFRTRHGLERTSGRARARTSWRDGCRRRRRRPWIFPRSRRMCGRCTALTSRTRRRLGSNCCWPGALRSAGCGSSRCAMPGAATGAGTRTAT